MAKESPEERLGSLMPQHSIFPLYAFHHLRAQPRTRPIAAPQVRIFQLDSDVTSREPKTRRVKTNKLPIGAGFADNDTVMVVEKGECAKHGWGLGSRTLHKLSCWCPAHTVMVVGKG